MSVGGHLKSLLWKNWLLWKRNRGGSLCELLFAMFIMLILLAVRLGLPPDDKDSKSYIHPDSDVGQIVALESISNKTFVDLDLN